MSGDSSNVESKSSDVGDFSHGIPWALEARLRELEAAARDSLLKAEEAIRNIELSFAEREEKRREMYAALLDGITGQISNRIDDLSKELKKLSSSTADLAEAKEIEELSAKFFSLETSVQTLKKVREELKREILKIESQISRTADRLENSIKSDFTRYTENLVEKSKSHIESILRDRISAFDTNLQLNFKDLQKGLERFKSEFSEKLGNDLEERIKGVIKNLEETRSLLKSRLEDAEKNIVEKINKSLKDDLNIIKERAHSTEKALISVQEAVSISIQNFFKELKEAISDSSKKHLDLTKNLDSSHKETTSEIIKSELGRPVSDLKAAQKNLEHLIEETRSRIETAVKEGEEKLKKLSEENASFLRISLVEAEDALARTMREIQRMADRHVQEQVKGKITAGKSILDDFADNAAKEVKKRLLLIPNKLQIPKSWTVAAAIAVIAAVLSPWVSGIILKKTTPPSQLHIQKSKNTFVNSTTTALKIKQRIPSIDLIDGSTLNSSLINIEGTAPWGSFVLLTVNGNEKALRFIDNNRYKFTNLHFKNGDFEIKVLSYGNAGLPVSSDPVRVKVDTSGAALPYRGTKNSISAGPVSKKWVALTFDALNSDRGVVEMLNVLKEENVHCTMFLSGSFIINYTKLVKRMLSDGHEIGNATWGTSHLTTFTVNETYSTAEKVSEPYIRMELKKTARAYQKITGRRISRLWRAPYGEFNPTILKWAASSGYKHVYWTKIGRESLNTNNWISDPTNPDYMSEGAIRDKILTFSKRSGIPLNGAIIRFRLDTSRDPSSQAVMLRDIIRGLRGMGMHLVRVSAFLVPTN